MKEKSYRTGELACMELLPHIGFTNVQDVSKSVSYQVADVDIIADKDGSQAKIEVKTDKLISSTGNMFIEIIQDRFSRTYYTGWFYKTTADYLCYIDYHGTDSTGMIFYFIDFSVLRSYVN